MRKAANLVLIILLLGTLGSIHALAQTSEITYQGNLKESGLPANANYDIEFRLFDAAGGGSMIGTAIFMSPVQVSDGVFSVKLDFGSSAFPGSDRYLEIAVRRTGVGSFVTLGPRQKIGSVPYAIQSLQAANATTSVIAQNALHLGGINSALFVQTGDPRLSDARSPLAGSSSYIQNSVNQQASSNFNITGTGTGHTFNATNRFNFAGNHILSAPGLDNIFAGNASGLLNLGESNAFFGSRAGQENKQGSFNAFYGAYAGHNNVTGSNNSFFGYFAGHGTTSGSDNSFFGNRAGQVNTSGAFNSFFGTFSGFFNTIGSDNSFFGNETGYNNSGGNRNSFFGSKAGRENQSGSDNAFLGSFAGRANTTGSSNSFVGSQAGQANATGTNNSFFGSLSGFLNTASHNSFFGTEAGRFNTIGANNTFVGRNAGHTNTSGELNVFVGMNAGSLNTVGHSNTIVGAEANVLNSNLSNATAIGAGAVVDTSNSVVLGRSLDTVRIPGSMTVQGTLNAANLIISATSITGIVGTSNGGTGLSSAGPSGNFLRSNGTTWQSQPLTIADILPGSNNYIQNSMTQQGSTNFNISGNGTAGGTLSANAINAVTQYNIGGNRVLTTAGSSNLFAGISAGNGNTTGSSNAFFGNSAGTQNSSGSSNSYFGANAGAASTSGGSNTFIGASAGSGNGIGANNSFFGANAGQSNTIGGNNTVIGANANVGSGTLSYATAVGADAVVSTNNTVVLGRSVDTVRTPGNLQVDGTLTAGSFVVPASSLTGIVAVINGGTGMNSPGLAGNYLRSNGSIWQSSAIAASDIPAGSANYIQNGVGVQASSNFNISGNGTVGGIFSANSVNSVTQYNIGGTRVLSNIGTANTFVGAGTSTGGNDNTLVGFGAGVSNSTGFSNTALGSGANFGAGNLTFATAIGAGALVNNNNSVILGRAADTVRIPGNLILNGTFTGGFTIPATNITGTLAAANGGTGLSGSTASNFLRGNGSGGWTNGTIVAGDIPDLGATYVRNQAGLQAGASFNVAGSGSVGTTMNVGGNLTVGGTISGNLNASNITGILGVANGGTGLNSAGTIGHFMKSTGSGFTTAALTVGDIPSLAGSYIQNNTTPQAGANFNVAGTGAVGSHFTVGGNLTVNGSMLGSFTIPASKITGTLGVANGGTGLTSAGTNGHFVKSNGTDFLTSALTASDIPAGSTNYVQNGTTPQPGTSFSVDGSGAVGTNFTVGQNLTVNGSIAGSFTVPVGNITGTLGPGAGGTGLTTSTGTQFLRGNNLGGWTSGALTAADIPVGSASYIQNTGTQQAGSNFNISGNGTAGGTLSGNIVNAVTQFNINNNRVLSTSGSNNVFVGSGTSTSGSSNSFVGSNAGANNTSGTSNTLVGSNAEVATGSLTNATAIGANAAVNQSNSLVLGGVTGVNGGTSVNVGIGTITPKTKLEVANGDIHVSLPGQGLILKSPNGGTCARLSLSDAGVLTTTVMPCP